MSKHDAIKAITTAIGGHGMWKQRLKSAVTTGTSEFSVANVSSDRNCDFGKWLYGDAAALPADIKGADYEGVRKLHAEFHQCAARTLDKALKGDEAGYDGDTKIGGAFSGASAKLTAAMTAWKTRLEK